MNLPGRNIEYYMAHSSHGWAGAGAVGQGLPGEQYDHQETLRRHRQNLQAAYEPEYDNYSNYRSQARRQRRDPSDISVEALDLADYARTLRRADVAQNDVYPHFNSDRDPYTRHAAHQPWMPVTTVIPHPHSPENRSFSPPSLPYPPLVSSNPVDRPFSALSRDTMMAPPSLVSNGTTSLSSHTNTTSPNHPLRRPFSLPADYNRVPALFNSRSPPPSARGVNAGRRAQLDTMEMDYNIVDTDVSSFPPWARKWYTQEAGSRKGLSPVAKGKRADIPRSPVEDEIFGPYIPPSALGSQRDLGLLPWTVGHPGDEPAQPSAVPDNVKEERIRMLEKEFGDRGPGRGFKQAFGDSEGIIGSIDEKGNLINAGPKRRIATRWLQAIFAVGAAGSGIYGALVCASTQICRLTNYPEIVSFVQFIKLSAPAPPSGHAAAFILYGLSVLTCLLLFFFFVITPLCLRRNKDDSGNPKENPAGMMVFPVSNSGQTGKKKGKRKGGKGGGAMEPGGSVQVNLIVDPGMFGRGTGTGRGHGTPGRYNDDDYDMDSDGGTNPSSRRRRQQQRDREGWDWDEGEDEARPPRRRSVFVGLAMERAWRRARGELKKRVGLDVAMTIAWTTCFVLILLGNRCPPGTLDGWCDAYNISTACASVLIVLFATSAFFGIKDLHQSKQSPRTRT